MKFTDSQKEETYKTLGLAAMHSGGAEYKVSWAMYLLEDGIETDDLLILATLLKPWNEFEVEDYFNRTLHELDIERPTSEKAIEKYIKVVASEAINEVVSPGVAVAKIYEANIQLGYPGELGEFTSLEDEWYCECINGWSKEKRNEEILKACREIINVF
jgi:hypothetical protein